MCRKFSTRERDAKCLVVERSDTDSGGPENRKAGGVGILVREYLAEDVMQIERISGRLLKMKIVIGRRVVNFFSACAPQVVSSEEEKDIFWGMLDDATTVADSEVLLVVGDLNGHIGEHRRGFEDIMGIHRFRVRNKEREYWILSK